MIPRGLGCLPSPRDDRDVALDTLRLSTFRAGRDPLAPLSVREHTHAVLDQGSSQSCTGQAVAVGYYCAARGHGIDAPLASPMVLYALGRHLHTPSGGSLLDTGSYLRAVLKAMTKHGVPSEASWPFDMGRINERPPWSVIRSAYDSRGPKGYYRALGTGQDLLDELDDALGEGYPFVWGTRVDRAFQVNDGPEYVPAMADGAGTIGGHALCALGRVWKDGTRWYETQNSWGTGWRGDGFAWLHERWVLDGFDHWLVLP